MHKRSSLRVAGARLCTCPAPPVSFVRPNGLNSQPWLNTSPCQRPARGEDKQRGPADRAESACEESKHERHARPLDVKRGYRRQDEDRDRDDL